tara:strand:- start:31598 stop:33337 length:1740 start_codon:yes stop_codon:yes gene_type:complete
MADIDALKKSIIETTRALSGNAELSVRFGDVAHISAHEIILPIFEDEQGFNAALVKGQADRLAFIYRYGDAADIFTQFANEDDSVLTILAMMETARTESQGLQDFPGSIQHIEPLLHLEELYFGEKGEDIQSQGYVASLMLKKRLTGNLSLEAKVLCKRLEFLVPIPLKVWAERANFETREARLKSYQQLVDLLEIQKQSSKKSSSSSADSTVEDYKDMQGDDATSEVAGESETIKEMDGEDSAVLNDDDNAGYSFIDMAQSSMPYFFKANVSTPSYRAYTKTFDVEEDISKLVDDSEKEFLRNKFASLSKSHKGLARQLSVKLMRKLMSRLELGWQLDKEEGVLDASKLAGFIAGGSDTIFRLPRKREVMDTAVTILVDNSGSMRGRPIEMAAITTDILAKTLENCGVSTEVLGFTTKAWKGGESRLGWISDGKPEHPGRLNDLLHIVYKKGLSSYKKQKDNFAYMLADDLLKENVDGESLLWAYKRLLRRASGRKILLVISDGAPVDYATDRHNEVGYLDQHLKQVIARIECNKKVEIVAVGIGHDVERYYKNAVMIENPEMLGETLLQELVKLFEE